MKCIVLKMFEIENTIQIWITEKLQTQLIFHEIIKNSIGQWFSLICLQLKEVLFESIASSSIAKKL